MANPAVRIGTPAATGDGELSIQMPAMAAAKPEKRLNCFVRILATGELVGNTLGTLASLWASVILLAGYRSSLNRVDFWIATVAIFVEAFRVFIRNFKFDNQSLFGTTKAVSWISSSFAHMLARPREGNEVVLIISGIMTTVGTLPLFGEFFRAAVLILMSKTQVSEIPQLMRRLRQRRPRLLWAVLIIPLVVAAAASLLDLDILMQLGAVVLLNKRPPRIGNLTRGLWGRSLLYLCKVISAILAFGLVLDFDMFFGLAMPFITAVAMPFITAVLLFGSLQNPSVPNSLFGRGIDVIMHIFFLLALVLPLPIRMGILTLPISIIVLLAVLLIGNLQIPAAFAQIGLSSWRLHSLQGDSPNMVASIAVFYVLALCQGSLYIMACILAMFSFFPRRSLVRRSEFRSKWGAKAVDLYYERAYTTRMEIGVFAEDTISLASFVVDSLNPASSSPESQLAGVRVLHSFLQRKDSNEELISVITRSEKAVPTLISMLGWTFEQDRDIRLFATRVIAQLSGGLRIAGNPGAINLVSSLLDADNQRASVNDEESDDNGPQGAQAAGPNEIGGDARNEPRRQGILPEAANANEEVGNPPSGRETSGDGANAAGSSFPVLGMVILERLAACDYDNCAEIFKTTNLVPKIIGLISYSSTNESSNDNALICSSLKLVRRLATCSGKIGATLRRELWDSPFLLSNIACVLEDSRSSPEVWKPAIDIIATMALDEGERQEIGRVQVIILLLLHVFIIGRDGPTAYDQSLRVTAGEALSNLAIESPANCLAITGARPEHELVKDLKDMLGSDEYRCVAASLLQNLCACSMTWDRLRHPGVSNHLSSALPVVLENTMVAEGKQLEALIGLASKICSVLPPERCVQGLESRIVGEAFVQKLVDTLNSNKKPSPEYPRMRRVIVELVISFLGRYPRYTLIFRSEGMINALSKVETTPSKVENYRIFLGDGVVLEQGEPLRDLVGRAKRLIHPATQAQ